MEKTGRSAKKVKGADRPKSKLFEWPKNVNPITGWIDSAKITPSKGVGRVFRKDRWSGRKGFVRRYT